MKLAVPLTAEQVPDKAYFKIGEAAGIIAVEPHVLRYWEAEFPIIKPNRIYSRQRLYRRVDVVNFLRIRSLLYDQGYTISGARQALVQGPDMRVSEAVEQSAALELKKIKEELKAIRRKLGEP